MTIADTGSRGFCGSSAETAAPVEQRGSNAVGFTGGCAPGGIVGAVYVWGMTVLGGTCAGLSGAIACSGVCVWGFAGSMWCFRWVQSEGSRRSQ